MGGEAAALLGKRVHIVLIFYIFIGSHNNLSQRVFRARPRKHFDEKDADEIGFIGGRLTTTSGILIFKCKGVYFQKENLF